LRDTGELFLIEELTPTGWTPIGDVTLQPSGIPILLCPPARGRGIGRNVLRTLITYAREAGRTEILVNEVYGYNDAARRLFTSAGFVPIGETELGHRYRLDL
jgi:L-amino acid N-acyltransferase YncA